MKQERVATFFCDHFINTTDNLHDILLSVIESAIVLHDINIFLFTEVSSGFYKVCYSCVCKLQEKYPYIKKAVCCHDMAIENLSDYIRYGFLQDIKFDKIIYVPISYDSNFSILNDLNYDLIDFCDYFIYCPNKEKDRVEIFAVEHQKYKLKP